MNYKIFAKQDNILQLLLANLGILTMRDRIIVVNIEPDDSISQYGREIAKDYYFVHPYSFKPYFRFLLNAEFLDTKIYNSDILKESLDENDDIQFNEKIDDVENTLNYIDQTIPAFFSENGYDTDELEDYKLHAIRVQNIDNTAQKVYYEGGYFGDNVVMEEYTCGWETFAKIRMMGIANDLDEFHKELLGESYAMLYNHNYKMSFFLAFTAFECFVNYAGNINNDNLRLTEKISKLYKDIFEDLCKHQIYSTLINEFDKYEKQRNDIAHGNRTDRIHIAKKDVQDFLLFCLTMITSYNMRVVTFDNLFNNINRESL